jgi:hypothetical protein
MMERLAEPTMEHLATLATAKNETVSQRDARNIVDERRRAAA